MYKFRVERKISDFHFSQRSIGFYNFYSIFFQFSSFFISISVYYFGGVFFIFDHGSGAPCLLSPQKTMSDRISCCPTV